jgi:hypothetical protein
VAFEEYRLRRQAGEDPAPAEYRERFGVDAADWPMPSQGATEAADAVHEVASAYQSWRSQGGEEAVAGREFPCKAVGLSAVHVDWFRQVHRWDPRAAQELARALVALPEVGSEFLGFRLEAELGRGAFGRVYLARQKGLAHRPVALKVSADVFADEAQTLAQLQHTHIVPVYSVHHARPFRAVCMPYFGATTLADVLRLLRGGESLPASGKGLVSTIVISRNQTLVSERSLGLAPVEVSTQGAAGNLPKRTAAVATLSHLEGLSYVEAVLWVAARLAGAWPTPTSGVSCIATSSRQTSS